MKKPTMPWPPSNFVLSFIMLSACFAGANQGIAATIVKFDPPGSVETEPTGISPDGTIIGGYTKSTRGIGWHAFLRTPDGSINTNFKVKGAKYGTNFDAINSSDVIVGGYADRFDKAHGFVRTAGGTITTFDAPHATMTGPTSINDEGVIVGCYRTDTYYSGPCVHGFIRGADGKFTTFDPKGSTCTVPVSINNDGTIAGDYSKDAELEYSYGFVRTPGGKITTFQVPSTFHYTIVQGVNKSGEIAGYYENYMGYFLGFVRAADGTISTIDPKNVSDVILFGLNDGGDVIGYYFTDFAHGFVRTDGGLVTTYDPRHSIDTQPVAINKNGAIAGDYWDGARTHGFIRTP